MLNYLRNRKRLKAMVSQLDLVLAGHIGVSRLRMKALFENVQKQASINGKEIKMFGSIPMTVLHWINTRNIYFTDGTYRKFDFYPQAKK